MTYSRTMIIDTTVSYWGNQQYFGFQRGGFMEPETEGKNAFVTAQCWGRVQSKGGIFGFSDSWLGVDEQ